MAQAVCHPVCGTGAHVNLRRSSVAHSRPARTYRRAVTTCAIFPFFPNPKQPLFQDGGSSGINHSELDIVPTVEAIKDAMPGWHIGRERGDDYDMLNKRFRCRNAKLGHQVLEILQQELYIPSEQGCRIRRETQALYYLCCHGVRARLNETNNEVLVEVPVPDGVELTLAQAKQLCDKIESIAKDASQRPR